MIALKKISGLGGEDNPGGLGNIIYFAPIEQFLVIKGLKTTNAEGDAVTIDGTHTFQDVSPDPALGFLTLYTTLGTGELKMEEAGDNDGKTYNVSLEGIHPGNSKRAAEFFRKVKNSEGIILIKHPDGVVEQIGTEIWPAKLSASFESSKPGAGVKGYKIMAQAFQMSKQFYEGVITLAEEV